MRKLNQPSVNPGAQELHAISLRHDVNKNQGTASSAPTFSSTISNAHGVTLVELIISMVIISIALVGVLSVMNFTTGRSADPMIQHQAIAIAEAYMEEILLQGYENPDGGYEGSDRDKFDDVDDYDDLKDDGARNQISPDVISGLGNYTVTVDVEEFTAAIEPYKRLGPVGKKVDTKKITVTVAHDTMGSIDLVGYRTEY
jgi:MSHA pilin protein MshD